MKPTATVYGATHGVRKSLAEGYAWMKPAACGSYDAAWGDLLFFPERSASRAAA